MISRKFPESFRGARDLVVLGGFWEVWKKPEKSLKKLLNTKSRAPLKLFGNLLEITWRCYDWILRKNEGSFLFCPVQALFMIRTILQYNLRSSKPFDFPVYRTKTERFIDFTYCSYNIRLIFCEILFQFSDKLPTLETFQNRSKWGQNS